MDFDARAIEGDNINPLNIPKTKRPIIKEYMPIFSDMLILKMEFAVKNDISIIENAAPRSPKNINFFSFLFLSAFWAMNLLVTKNPSENRTIISPIRGWGTLCFVSSIGMLKKTTPSVIKPSGRDVKSDESITSVSFIKDGRFLIIDFKSMRGEILRMTLSHLREAQSTFGIRKKAYMAQHKINAKDNKNMPCSLTRGSNKPPEKTPAIIAPLIVFVYEARARFLFFSFENRKIYAYSADDDIGMIIPKKV